MLAVGNTGRPGAHIQTATMKSAVLRPAQHPARADAVGDLARRGRVLDRRIGPPGDGLIPRSQPFPVPDLLNLSCRLEQELQRDAVFAAGFAGDLEFIQTAEPCGLVVQNEDTAI